MCLFLVHRGDLARRSVWDIGYPGSMQSMFMEDSVEVPKKLYL